MHVNCRSLNMNFNALLMLLHKQVESFSAIAVTETWLSDMNKDDFVIDGFNFICKCRSGKIGGGVGLYLANDLRFFVREDLSMTKEYIECLFVEINQPNFANIIVGTVYRPPNSDVCLFNTTISNILDKLDANYNKHVFIAGDFNLDLLKFDNHAPTGEFLNTLLSHSLMPTIRYPTRIKDTTATLIDNVFVSSIAHEFDTAIIYSDISDHLPIALTQIGRASCRERV